MFARLRNPIAYDCSSLVRNALYDNFGDSAVLTRTTISMMHMHDFLVKHFTYLWSKKEIRWSSMLEKVVRGSV